MVGHNGGLPNLYLWVKMMNLGKFFFENGTAKWTELNVWEVCGAAFVAEVPCQLAEKRLSPFDTEGDHVESGIAIVLPWGTAMLVVLNFPRGDM